MSYSNVRDFQIGDVLSAGWDGFKTHYGVLIPAFIIAAVVTIFVTAPLSIAAGLAEDNGFLFAIFSLLRGIAQSLLNAVFQLGFIAITLKIARGQTPEISDLFSNFDKLLTLFLVNVILGIAISLGFLMLIIPGIVIATLTCLAPWFVADRNLGVVESIMASYEATKGSFFNVLLFGIVGFVMIVIGSIPCGLGLLVVIPVLSVAATYIYLALAPNPDQMTAGDIQ